MKERVMALRINVMRMVGRVVLAVLNSRLVNPTPCRYEFVDNIRNFSRADIGIFVKGAPQMPLRVYAELADELEAKGVLFKVVQHCEVLPVVHAEPGSVFHDAMGRSILGKPRAEC